MVAGLPILPLLHVVQNVEAELKQDTDSATIRNHNMVDAIARAVLHTAVLVIPIHVQVHMS